MSRRRRKQDDLGRQLMGLGALIAIAIGLQNMDKLAYLGAAAAVLVVIGFFAQRWWRRRWLERHTDLATILLMSPRRFEEFCKDLLAREGFRARVTQYTNDQGVDVLLDGPSGKGLAQVKRWTNLPVGRPVIQQLYGEMSHRGSQYGYMITTSWFTREASDWVGKKPITLVDGRALEAMASRHFGRVQLTSKDILPPSTSARRGQP